MPGVASRERGQCAGAPQMSQRARALGVRGLGHDRGIGRTRRPRVTAHRRLTISSESVCLTVVPSAAAPCTESTSAFEPGASGSRTTSWPPGVGLKLAVTSRPASVARKLSRAIVGA